MAVTCGIFHYLAPGAPCCLCLCIVLLFFHSCLLSLSLSLSYTHTHTHTHSLSFSHSGVLFWVSRWWAVVCCLLSSQLYGAVVVAVSDCVISSPWPVVPPALAPTPWWSSPSGQASTAWTLFASTYGWGGEGGGYVCVCRGDIWERVLILISSISVYLCCVWL